MVLVHLCIHDHMIQRGVGASISRYARLLQECTKRKALKEGMQVHADITKCGVDSNIYLGNVLIDMYAKCDSILYARQVFKEMPEHNLFSWTAIISAYVKHGRAEEAAYLYQQMQLVGLAPDKYIFVFALKACASMGFLDLGKHIHEDVVKTGLEAHLFVGNAIVDMYSKCHNMDDALNVFHQIAERDVISWNILITGCTYQGLLEEPFTLFGQMREEGLKPNDVTYVVFLKACSIVGSLDKGKMVHVEIAESCSKSHPFVLNTLVDMYAKCGSIKSARSVFDKMPARDVTSWNVMIAAYTEKCLGLEALTLFEHMEKGGVKPNNVTFATILKACTQRSALEQGKSIHAELIKTGLKLDVVASSSLVHMHVKCGSITHAQRVFNEMSERDLVSWNVIIAGCAQQSLGEEVLMHFQQMLQEVMPDKVTYICLLQACSNLAALNRGRHIHVHLIEVGLQSDLSVSNTLVDMYAKCGRLDDAFQVFTKMRERDVVSWNIMIAGYAQEGCGDRAVQVFEQMLQEPEKPNNITFNSIVKACANAEALEYGKQIHDLINISGHESEISVRSALVGLYAKCGSIEDALNVFSRMQERPVVSWTIIITGFAQHGLGKEALQLFDEMQEKGIRPDEVTFVSVLSACSRAGLLQEGCHHFHSMRRCYGTCQQQSILHACLTCWDVWGIYMRQRV